MKNSIEFSEYLDVLDSDWNFTWKVKNWLDVHKDWDWHGAVHIWIFNNKKQILIRKRVSDKLLNPSKWDIGGWWHIFVWDNGIDSAIKKVLFEWGIELFEKNLKFLFTLKNTWIYNNGTYIDNEIFSVYFLNINIDENLLKPSKKYIQEFRFIDIGDLKTQSNNRINQDFIVRKDEFEKILTFYKTLK